MSCIEQGQLWPGLELLLQYQLTSRFFSGSLVQHGYAKADKLVSVYGLINTLALIFPIRAPGYLQLRVYVMKPARLFKPHLS